MQFLLSFILLIGLSCSANAASLEEAVNFLEPKDVRDVKEGITLYLNDGRQVTFALMTVPITLGDNANKGNERRLNRANSRLLKLIEGKDLVIKPASGELDRYGRLNAHIYSKDTNGELQDVGIVLLSEGFVALRHPEKENLLWESYLEIEDLARQAKLGIWRERIFSPSCEAEAKFKASRYAIIAGDIEAVSVQRQVIYINFTDNWREDFTVRLVGRGRNRLYETIKDRVQAGSWVEVRGWVSWTNGPLIDLRSTNQLRNLIQAPDYCQMVP